MVVALRTTASVPALALVNRELKLARSVSLSARVPVRKATPRKMAKTVPARRRLWAQRLLAVTASMVGSLSDAGEAGQDGLGGGLVKVVDDVPVGQEGRGLGVGGGGGVVGE